MSASAGQENLDAEASFQVNLDSKGRVLLPAKLREKAGFKEGDLLSISLSSDLVAHISPLKKRQSLRGLWKPSRKGKSIVDEFLKERKKEALNE